MSVNGAAEDLLMIQLWEAEPFGSADIWFGFNDNETDGQWVWSDDSPVTYLSWKDQQPNGSPVGIQDYDCGNLNSSPEWGDNNCSLEKLYVCECVISSCLSSP